MKKVCLLNTDSKLLVGLHHELPFFVYAPSALVTSLDVTAGFFVIARDIYLLIFAAPHQKVVGNIYGNSCTKINTVPFHQT